MLIASAGATTSPLIGRIIEQGPDSICHTRSSVSGLTPGNTCGSCEQDNYRRKSHRLRRWQMSFERLVKVTLALSAAGIIAIAAMHARSVNVQAHDQDSDDDLAEIGLSIAPDFINMTGKDPKLVGLGSFIVNGQADCNGCHGSDPAHEYLPTNNPYFRKPNNSPAKYNQATYLNGGQNFGPVGPGIVQDPNSPLFGAPGLGPNIISRNLTPDKSGNPE